VLERGVSTADLGAALTDCGRSHSTGSVCATTAIRSRNDAGNRGLPETKPVIPPARNRRFNFDDDGPGNRRGRSNRVLKAAQGKPRAAIATGHSMGVHENDRRGESERGPITSRQVPNVRCRERDYKR
jgi:hypothetical protein